MGLMEVASLIGGAAAPWAVQWLRIVHKRLPFLLMGGVTILASFLCFFLKETNGQESAELLNTAKPVGGIKTLFFVSNSSRNFVKMKFLFDMAQCKNLVARAMRCLLSKKEIRIFKNFPGTPIFRITVTGLSKFSCLKQKAWCWEIHSKPKYWGGSKNFPCPQSPIISPPPLSLP